MTRARHCMCDPIKNRLPVPEFNWKLHTKALQYLSVIDSQKLTAESGPFTTAVRWVLPRINILRRTTQRCMPCMLPAHSTSKLPPGSLSPVKAESCESLGGSTDLSSACWSQPITSWHHAMPVNGFFWNLVTGRPCKHCTQGSYPKKSQVNCGTMRMQHAAVDPVSSATRGLPQSRK